MSFFFTSLYYWSEILQSNVWDSQHFREVYWRMWIYSWERRRVVLPKSVDFPSWVDWMNLYYFKTIILTPAITQMLYDGRDIIWLVHVHITQQTLERERGDGIQSRRNCEKKECTILFHNGRKWREGVRSENWSI